MIVHALLQLELATQGHQGILVADLATQCAIQPSAVAPWTCIGLRSRPP